MVVEGAVCPGDCWGDAGGVVGVALGLAILSALATARTNSLLSAHHPVPDAVVGGYTRALLAAAVFVGAVVLIGLRAANTKGEPPGGMPTEITGAATDERKPSSPCVRSWPPILTLSKRE